MQLKHVFCAFSAFGILSGCVVEPSDPGEPPIVTIFEKRPDGGTRVAYSNDPNVRAIRTTCADGRLPNEVLALPDTPETWNAYYVLEPGQTEVTFGMSVISLSGVVTWIMNVGDEFAVTDPAADPLPFGATVFDLPSGPPYLSLTTNDMTLERTRRFARAEINSIIDTGSAGGLERGEGEFTLISECRRGN